MEKWRRTSFYFFIPKIGIGFKKDFDLVPVRKWVWNQTLGSAPITWSLDTMLIHSRLCIAWIQSKFENGGQGCRWVHIPWLAGLPQTSAHISILPLSGLLCARSFFLFFLVLGSGILWSSESFLSALYNSRLPPLEPKNTCEHWSRVL